jgi:SAM-dependent methyltransferase
MSKSLRREFDAVDKTDDPRDFVRYLDTVRSTDFFQEIKRRTVAAMALQAGETAIDVGCGTGEDVRALEAGVGPNGRAVGVDISATMIATARERSREHQSRARFVRGDAHRLPFMDACADAIRTERLLQHSPDPDAALREIVRLARPGGRVVIWEGDLDLFIIDAPDYDASRVIQRIICDQFRNGAIGHRLYGLFLESGLVDVQSTPLIRPLLDLPLVESAFNLTASVALAVERALLDAGRAARWLDSLRAASRDNRFFSAVGGFITAGRKP